MLSDKVFAFAKTHGLHARCLALWFQDGSGSSEREREDGYLRWNLLKVLSFLGWSGSVRSRGERRSSINRSYRNRIPACSYSSVSFGHLSQEKETLTHRAKPALFDGSWEVNILDYPSHVTAHGFMAYILIHFDSRIVWSLYFLALQLCEVSSCLQEAMDATLHWIVHLSSFIIYHDFFISFVKDLRAAAAWKQLCRKYPDLVHSWAHRLWRRLNLLAHEYETKTLLSLP